MYFTKVRGEPRFQTSNIFQGEEEWLCVTPKDNLELAKYAGDLYTDKVLYHFEFVKSTTPIRKGQEVPLKYISQYFGVMDIDIEASKTATDAEFTVIKAEYLEMLKEKLEEMNYTNYRIYFSGSKGFHVYIYDSKLWRTPMDDLNSDQRLEWINQQVDVCFPELSDKLDRSIYRINNGIRSFTYPHPKKHVLCKEVFATDSAPVCHWSWIFDMCRREKVLIVPSIISSTRPPISIAAPVRGDPNQIVVAPTGEPLLDRARLLCQSIHSTILPTLIDKGLKKGSRVYVVDGKYCPIKCSDHSQKQKCYIIDKTATERQVKIKCHTATCRAKGDIVVKEHCQPLTAIYPTIQNLQQDGIIVSSPKRVRIIQKEQKYISERDIEFALDGGYGLISAPMGTGKTTALKTWLSKQPADFKVLLVVVRRTQAANFVGVYPGMQNYQNVEGSLFGLTSVVVCVNSLQRVREPTLGTIPHYDLLILDEIESTLEGLTNPQLSCSKSKQCDIWQLFKILIYSSRNVLFMDGILTDNTIRYLDDIKILSDCNLVEHSIQPDKRTYVNYSHLGSFEKDFEKDINNKLKICLVSNAKSSLLMYANKAQGLGVAGASYLSITGDSSEVEKMTSSDPNNLWEKDVLAFNTAVGPGASFDKLHYDVMYVMCTPLSCSPYWMYQMINRIRHLSKNLVRIIVSWNEEKKVPTLEDYELKKAQNIVNMNWNQTKYPIPLAYFDANGADTFMLDISPANRQVIRKLVQDQRLVLRHEDDHFLKTLARYEHKKLTLNNTEAYSKLLFEIIRRNGGTVKRELDYSSADTLKTIKLSTVLLRKSSNDYYSGIGKQADNCITKNLAPYREDREFIETLNRQVHLNDINTQITWSQFRRALIRSDQTNYENELKDINDNSKAVNNTLIYSNGLLESFRTICEICGFTINQANGIIQGESSVDVFLGNHKRINDNVEMIKSQLFNKNKITGSDKNKFRDSLSLTKKNSAVFSNLKFALKQLGITVIKNKANGRPTCRETNERYARWTFEISTTCQHIRLALDGLAYNTGLPHNDAVGLLRDKWRQNNSN